MLQQVMTEPGKIIFREVPEIEPAAGEVKIKIMNIGVCGSDIHVYHGKHPFTKYPVTQGHEVSGLVEKLGEGVDNLKIGQKGGCVIVGRAADYILRDNPRLTSVFIHAKDDFRAQRIMEYEHISKDKALDMIAKADKKRASFYNFQTEKKWGQAASYNLTVDTSALGIDGCVTLIRRYLELRNR